MRPLERSGPPLQGTSRLFRAVNVCHKIKMGRFALVGAYGLEPSGGQTVSSLPRLPDHPAGPYHKSGGRSAGPSRLSFTLSALAGWKRQLDSNQQIQGSKPRALPLGDASILPNALTASGSYRILSISGQTLNISHLKGGDHDDHTCL